MDNLERIGVVGCGLMGAGIAEVSARRGCQVTVVEVSATAAEGGRARVTSSLERESDPAGCRSPTETRSSRRPRFVDDLAALADAQLVIEAVLESETAKLEVFKILDDVVLDEGALLTSNTSSIPIMKLAMATRRPEMVLGIHFFNPVPVLDLVELIPSLLQL